MKENIMGLQNWNGEAKRKGGMSGRDSKRGAWRIAKAQNTEGDKSEKRKERETALLLVLFSKGGREGERKGERRQTRGRQGDD